MKTRSLQRLVVLCLLVLLRATVPGDASERPARDDSLPSAGTLQGRVLANAEGIPHAVITLKVENSWLSSQRATNEDGEFAFRLPPGRWQVGVAARGFRPLEDVEPIEIEPNGSVTKDFVLQPSERDVIPAGQGIRGMVILAKGMSARPQKTRPRVDVQIVALPEKETIDSPTANQRGFFQSNLPAGGYRVVAGAEGYRKISSPVCHVFPGRYTSVNLILAPTPPPETESPPVVELTVIDKKTEQPLTEVSVRVRREGRTDERGIISQTNAAGQTTVKVPTPGNWEVTAALKGYAIGRETLKVAGGMNRLKIGLERGTSKLLVVVVSDAETSKPVAGAKVSFRKEKLKSKTTDNKGSVGFDSPGRGPGGQTVKAELTVEAEGFQRWSKAGEFDTAKVFRLSLDRLRTPMVEPPPDKPVLLAKQFEFTVVDSKTLEGLAEAKVTLTTEAGKPVDSGTTDESGQVKVACRGLGVYGLAVEREGYKSWSKPSQLDPAKAVRIPLDRLTTPTVKVFGHVGSMVESTKKVLDITDAEISWVGERAQTEVQSDFKGGFSVELPADQYQVTIRAEGFQELEKTVTLEKSRERIQFLLVEVPRDTPPRMTDLVRATGTVFGKVDGGKKVVDISNAEIAWVGKRAKTQIKSGFKGAFSIELPEDQYQATVRAKGFRELKKTVTIEKSGKAIEFMLTEIPRDTSSRTMDLVRATGHVFGKVDGGKKVIDISNAQIAWVGKRAEAKVESGSKGAFSIELPADQYQATVRAKGFQTLEQTVAVEKSSKPIEFTLVETARVMPQKSSVVIKILDSTTKRPINDESVVVLLDGNAVKRGISKEGVVSMPVTDGDHRIAARAKGYISKQITVELAGKDVHQTIELTPDRPELGRWTINVSTPNERRRTQPLAGALIVIREKGHEVARQTTNENGSSSRELPLGGHYDVTITKPGYSTVEFDLTLHRNPTTSERSLEPRVTPPPRDLVKVRGNVVAKDDGGKTFDVPNAKISLFASSGAANPIATCMSGSRGSFSLPDPVPQGTYTFRVSARGFEEFKKEEKVAGRPIRLELVEASDKPSLDPFKPGVRGIDPAALSLTAVVKRRLSAHTVELAIVGVVTNIGSEDFVSGKGQQAVRLYEHAPGAKAVPVVTEEFGKLPSGKKIVVELKRSWSRSAEFPQDFRLQIDYDPDIRMDGNRRNDDVVVKDNAKELKGTKVTAIVAKWLDENR